MVCHTLNQIKPELIQITLTVIIRLWFRNSFELGAHPDEHGCVLCGATDVSIVLHTAHAAHASIPYAANLQYRGLDHRKFQGQKKLRLKKERQRMSWHHVPPETRAWPSGATPQLLAPAFHTLHRATCHEPECTCTGISQGQEAATALCPQRNTCSCSWDVAGQ